MGLYHSLTAMDIRNQHHFHDPPVSRINSLAGILSFPRRLLQMRRCWASDSSRQKLRILNYTSTPPDLCLQDLVETKVVRIFLSFKFRSAEKIFVKLVSQARDSWLLGMRTHGFCFSLSLLSFLLSSYTYALRCWPYERFLWPVPSRVHLALSRHEQHSEEFSVSILFLPEMVYYLHQLGDAYASGGQPIQL